MTYQSFTTPRKLLEKLFQRYEVPPNRYKGDDNMRYTRRHGQPIITTTELTLVMM
jgi:hypothetical protein